MADADHAIQMLLFLPLPLISKQGLYPAVWSMVSQVVVWAGVDLSGSTPAQYLAEHETEHRHFIANTSIVTGE